MLNRRFAMGWVLVSLSSACPAWADSPFFCTDFPNHGFDCVEHSNIFDANTILCPDPVLEPWCACLKTYFSTEAPGGKPSISQEVLYREGQSTAGSYLVDVSGGTLDLSTLSVGDVVFDFLICVDKSIVSLVIGGPSPLPFELDFEAQVTAKSASSVDVLLQLPPDAGNDINKGILNYDPIDEMHSFGKTFVGKLTSRGPGKGFTFEYDLYVPDPLSASPFRGISDGDLGDPGFTVEAMLRITDGDVGLYTNPPCGKVVVSTSISPLAPIGDLTEKTFESVFDFGGGDFTVGITGNTSATVGDTVLLTATTNAAPPPAFTWEKTSGTATLVDNGNGTANVTSSAEGPVTIKLTGKNCGVPKTAEITITFSKPAGGRQKPGDANQDGKLDLSDPVLVLNFLFLGTVPRLPCGDGSVSDPANLTLLNGNNDNKIDLSDPVGVLGFLFLGSAAPPSCAGDVSCPCITILDCPDNAKCP